MAKELSRINMGSTARSIGDREATYQARKEILRHSSYILVFELRRHAHPAVVFKVCLAPKDT